jgi:hypothetical protein
MKEANDATIADHIDAMRAAATIYGGSQPITDSFQVRIACLVYLVRIEPVSPILVRSVLSVEL